MTFPRLVRYLIVLTILASMISWSPPATIAQDAPIPEPTAEVTPTNGAEPLPTVETETETAVPEESPSPELPTETTEAPSPVVTDTPFVEPTEPAATAPAPTSTVAPPTATGAGLAPSEEYGTLQVRTLDQFGELVPGAGYRALHKVGDNQYEGFSIYAVDTPNPDGTTEFQPLVAGWTYVVITYLTPPGYIGEYDTIFATVTIAANSVTTVDYTVFKGGNLNIHAEDENGATVLQGCYALYKNVGGARGEQASYACDESWSPPIDGVAQMVSLVPGDYFLAGHRVVGELSPSADLPITIEVGVTTEITFVWIPAGIIEITKISETGSIVLNACFTVYRDLGGGAYHGWDGYSLACDWQGEKSDGKIRIHAPVGGIVLEEGEPPEGYLKAENVLMTIESGVTYQITVVDNTTSNLLASMTDLWGNAINEQACLRLNVDLGGGEPGDSYGEECSNYRPKRNEILFEFLPPGKYLLTLTSCNNPGCYQNEPLSVSVGLSTTRTVKFRMHGPPPTLLTGPYLGSLTQFEAMIRWDTSQPVVGRLRYGLSEDFGRNATMPATESRTHKAVLTGLRPNRTYYLQILGSNGNGEYASEVLTFHTPALDETASVVITKTNSDGSKKLGGSCFHVTEDAGDGEPGETIAGGCDKFDATPNDGLIRIDALPAGNYVLVETQSPSGYSLARSTPFSLADGQSKKITVKDTRGGATIEITTRDPGGAPLKGSCYAIFDGKDGRPGTWLTTNCDSYDGMDGITRIGAFRAGAYYYRYTSLPEGYMWNGYDEFRAITVRSGQTRIEIMDGLHSQSDPSNIVMRTVDEHGVTIPGACFALYENIPGRDSWMSDACDEDDGHWDGKTVFRYMPAVRYSAVQFWAAPGYQVGTRLSFSKREHELRTLTVIQKPGNLKVKVTTFAGNTTTRLKGACYGLYLPSGYNDFVTGACDSNLDGYLEIAGVPPGEYTLFQSLTPTGYRTPPYIVVTVTDRSISRSIRTFRL